MKYLFAAVLLVMLLLYSGYYLFSNGIIWFVYPDKTEYPVMGIDVSHHQGEIDWKEVARQGVRFAFVKATEGGDFKDPRFDENIQGAQKVNIPVGAYHFFTFCRSGFEQAKNFIETVPKEGLSMPPVVDLEFGGNCSVVPTHDELVDELSKFVELLTGFYYVAPVFYVTTEFLEAYPIDKFQNIQLWIRNIYRQPEPYNKRNCTFWQYHSRGRLKGISGFVDLNVYCSDEESFQQYLGNAEL